MIPIGTNEYTKCLCGIIAILLCIYVYKVNNVFKYWKRRNIPYIKPTLFFGNFTDLVLRRKTFSEQMIDLYNQYDDPCFGMFIFHTPYLLIKDPDLIKRVLVKDFSVFSDRKVSSNENVDPVAFNSLLSAGGARWKAIRSKLSPVFTSGKMKLMMPLIDDSCDDLVMFLNSKVNSVVDAKGVVSKFMIDVISKCAFGLNSNCLKEDDSFIGKMAKQLIDPNSVTRTFSIMCFFFVPFLTNLFKLTFVEKESQNFFLGLFKQAIERRAKEKVVKNDFVDILSGLKNDEGGYQFDDTKMGGQAISFFIAGNDSTSTILSFLINEITLHPSVQDRMVVEIDGLYEQCDGKISYDDLGQLKYMDMVIKETLRKYPLGPMLVRKSNRPYEFETIGLEIEEDTAVLISVSGLHNDPQYFPDPAKFDPERFSDENKDAIVPYTYMPFGEGPRYCIGERFALMVMKVALISMLRRFQFVRCAETQDPIEINKISAFLQPKHGVPVRVIRRSR